MKYIWFSIEPSENDYPYSCPRCGGLGVYNCRQVSSKTIGKAVQDLVVQLSIWEPSGSLTLDISVKAPSGIMRSRSIIQYGPPVILEPTQDEIIQCSHLIHDRNLQGPATTLFDSNTKFSEPELKPSEEMPKARAVTKVLLRRQTRRLWKSEILQDLVGLLPEVHEVHYEPWRDWHRMEQQPANTGKARDTFP